MKVAQDLNSAFDMLDCNELTMANKRSTNDCIAGDLMSVGWLIYRNGVVVNNDFERRLGHAFQTILMTNKMVKYSPNSSWIVINS